MSAIASNSILESDLGALEATLAKDIENTVTVWFDELVTTTTFAREPIAAHVGFEPINIQLDANAFMRNTIEHAMRRVRSADTYSWWLTLSGRDSSSALTTRT